LPRQAIDKKKIRREKKTAEASGETYTPPGASSAPLRLRRPREGEVFAVVLRMLGGNHIEVQCQDGEKRMARIPGKIRRRKWVRVGDLVIVMPWYGVDEKAKADLIERFRETETRAYLDRGMLRGLEDLIGR
jgi:translation initiation factor 1A